MDRSKEYVNMCEQAKEIQEGWPCSYGDLMWSRPTNTTMFIQYSDISYYLQYKETRRPTYIWIPSQDQLQGMLRNESPLWLLGRFKEFTDTINIGSMGNGIENSMEKLWLAFVMSEKYHKQWTGERWEEISGKERI